MFNRSFIWAALGLTATLVAGTLVSAQGVRTERTDKETEDRYRQCLDLAETAPDKAIDNALDWQSRDGGIPARHCEAIALATAGEYGEAAGRLEGLVEDMRIGNQMPVVGGKRITADAAMLADVYGQAANAWLLADEVGRALDAVDAALSLVPDGTPQEMALLVDRARIAAADEDYQTAYQDLTRVRIFDPGRRDILIFMATAARALGRYDEAEVALEGYRLAYPGDLAGLLEDAHLKDALGRTDEARRLYLKVADADPDGPLGEAARANIARLDLKLGDEESDKTRSESR